MHASVVAHTAIGSPDAPRTLVCHPGGPGMSGRYLGDLGGLAGDALRIIQVHPRGTAGTPPPAGGDYRLERYADDLDELRDDLGLERLDLLGHSHGGFVAITYAARHADRLGDLVLAFTAPRFGAELGAEMDAAVARRADQPWFADAVKAMRRRRARDYVTTAQLRDLYTREARLWFRDPADARRIATRDDEFDMEALHTFNDRIAPTHDLRPLLPGITARTLVLVGALDFFGPQVAARELAAIPGAEIAVIPDAGHYAWIDAPEAFRMRLATFLGL